VRAAVPDVVGDPAAVRSRATTIRSRATTRSFCGFGRGLGDPSVMARNPIWQEIPTMELAPAGGYQSRSLAAAHGCRAAHRQDSLGESHHPRRPHRTLGQYSLAGRLRSRPRRPVRAQHHHHRRARRDQLGQAHRRRRLAHLVLQRHRRRHGRDRNGPRRKTPRPGQPRPHAPRSRPVEHQPQVRMRKLTRTFSGVTTHRSRQAIPRSAATPRRPGTAGRPQRPITARRKDPKCRCQMLLRRRWNTAPAPGRSC
jgi:hypothetical protein